MLTQTQKLLLFSQYMVANTAAKCPFGFGSSNDEAKPEDHALPQLDDLVVSSDEKTEVRKLSSDILYPSQLFQCTETDVKKKLLRTADNFTTQEYMDIAESVNELYDDAEDKNAFAGCLVRLAGHDMMDFRYHFGGRNGKTVVDKKGGSDGCINFTDKDNRGLIECIEDTNLQEAYDEHCGVVSLADFIVIAAEATMARTSKSYGIQQEYNPNDRYGDGTVAKAFRDQFKYGRTTNEECEWNTGLMPDPEKGMEDIENIFFKHMFRNQKKNKKRLTAAIMGAHTLGRARIENSGYEGTWSAPGSEGVFDNDYYRQMLTRGWGPQLAVNGDTERNQWKTVDNGSTTDEDVQMMLNSDLGLAYDNNSKHQKCMAEHNNNNRKCKSLQNKGEPINALHSQCCAWTNKGALFNKGVFDKKAGPADLCGAQIPSRGQDSKFAKVQEACCSNIENSTGDCDSSAWPKGKMFPHVLTFAANENQWLESFAQAWKIATENSHLDLQSLVEQEDNEDEYECGKLKTRQICQTDNMCAWQRKSTPDARGRMRKHCDLASKAPPAPEKKKKMKKNKKDRQNKKKNNDNKDKN